MQSSRKRTNQIFDPVFLRRIQETQPSIVNPNNTYISTPETVTSLQVDGSEPSESTTGNQPVNGAASDFQPGLTDGYLPDIGVTPDFQPGLTDGYLPDIGVTPDFQPGLPGGYLPDIGVTPDFQPGLPGGYLPDIGVTPDFQPGLPGGYLPDIGVTPESPSFPFRNYGYIRFLYAAINQPLVNMFVDGNLLVGSLRYANVSPYYALTPGSHLITANNAGIPSNVLASLQLPLLPRQIYTIAIVNSGSGISLFPILDPPCAPARGAACLRAINLMVNSPTVNVFMSGQGLTFSQLNYQSISSYRQLPRGNYNTYVTSSSTTVIPVGTQLQIAILNGTLRPIIASRISLEANTVYSLYLIGNPNGFPSAQTLLAETELSF